MPAQENKDEWVEVGVQEEQVDPKPMPPKPYVPRITYSQRMLK